MFEAATAVSREPHWYVGGQIPDTLDGRFAVLATILAILMVRLEREEARGDLASVALTERFIEVMETEHRELGLGDPTLGKTVRKLVSMLARRTEVWRQAVSGEKAWTEGVRESLYRDDAASDALRHCAEALQQFAGKLNARSIAEIEQGRIA